MNATDTFVLAQRDSATHCDVVAQVLACIGDKWSGQIIAVLSSGEAIRYSELMRRLDGISQRMLTLSLKNLEKNGVIHREQFPTIPPRVEYRLTALGVTLLVPLRALVDWSSKHGAAWRAAAHKSQEMS